MFKLALNAGHGINTAGKRTLKSIDPAETREWTLNSRICDKVEDILADYEMQIVRTDDKSGCDDIPIQKRTATANAFSADIYVSVHHNAGINGKSGGGIMAYTYPTVDEVTKKLQMCLYDKLVAKTGLKGNRVDPLETADFAECRLTKMPAVLLECGFMDSLTDTPIILTEDFAQKAAEGIAEAVIEYGKIKKREKSGLYRVQTGAFSERKNAEKLLQSLKNAGFDGFIKYE